MANPNAQSEGAAVSPMQASMHTALQDTRAAVCPICGSPDPRTLTVIDAFHVLRCAQCAADFVYPAPDESTLRAYYDRADWFEGGERGGYANYDEQTAPQLAFFETILDSFGADGAGKSVLDIGCGYGTHLERAHRRGWKCFGIEVSAHARKVIADRHDQKFFIAEGVEQLIPHEFDLILLFDVIEHLVDPYHLFYALFAKGAITPKTKVVIATPNARSSSAVSNPSGWAYRHPPSHLTYFSGKSLTTFLKRLHFDAIDVQGAHDEATEFRRYPDESDPINDALASYGGLVCTATGSDFAGFMQERYVPGTWSRIAEYEHLPRYLFARDIAAGRQALDFGCGTGYGTSLLAQKARSVVGIDIDAEALEWAREHHKKPNLSYQQRADFCASLPDSSFELITCFEMIEHVAEPAQRQAVQNFSRLLTPNGLALVSTPNPEITKLYGANPYHIREMSKAEFEELLREHFEYVEIFEQYIQASVLIARSADAEQTAPLHHLAWDDQLQSKPEPAVYLALCSHAPLPHFDSASYLDFRTNYIRQEIEIAEQLDRARFDHFQATEKAASKDVLAELHTRNLQVAELETALNDVKTEMHSRNIRILDLETSLHARNLRVNELEAELHVRNLRVLELEKIEIEIREELARYNWIRKIDRKLIQRK